MPTKLKHDYRALRRCYRNNRHDAWWKALRALCRRMAKRAERQRLPTMIGLALADEA